MLANAPLEAAPHDAAFQRIVAAMLERIEGFFRRSVAAGQADGPITAAAPRP